MATPDPMAAFNPQDFAAVLPTVADDVDLQILPEEAVEPDFFPAEPDVEPLIAQEANDLLNLLKHPNPIDTAAADEAQAPTQGLDLSGDASLLEDANALLSMLKPQQPQASAPEPTPDPTPEGLALAQADEPMATASPLEAAWAEMGLPPAPLAEPATAAHEQQASPLAAALADFGLTSAPEAAGFSDFDNLTDSAPAAPTEASPLQAALADFALPGEADQSMNGLHEETMAPSAALEAAFKAALSDEATSEPQALMQTEPEASTGNDLSAAPAIDPSQLLAALQQSRPAAVEPQPEPAQLAETIEASDPHEMPAAFSTPSTVESTPSMLEDVLNQATHSLEMGLEMAPNPLGDPMALLSDMPLPESSSEWHPQEEPLASTVAETEPSGGDLLSAHNDRMAASLLEPAPLESMALEPVMAATEAANSDWIAPAEPMAETSPPEASAQSTDWLQMEAMAPAEAAPVIVEETPEAFLPQHTAPLAEQSSEAFHRAEAEETRAAAPADQPEGMIDFLTDPFMASPAPAEPQDRMADEPVESFSEAPETNASAPLPSLQELADQSAAELTMIDTAPQAPEPPAAEESMLLEASPSVPTADSLPEAFERTPVPEPLASLLDSAAEAPAIEAPALPMEPVADAQPPAPLTADAPERMTDRVSEATDEPSAPIAPERPATSFPATPFRFQGAQTADSRLPVRDGYHPVSDHLQEFKVNTLIEEARFVRNSINHLADHYFKAAEAEREAALRDE
jgi:hypothetical protein